MNAATSTQAAQEFKLDAFWRRKLIWIMLIGFVLRVAFIFIAHSYKPNPRDGTISLGWEMGRIGASLATGQGYSSPFQTPTGPTAWEPPLYPFLIAGVFKVFGVYSKASAIIAQQKMCGLWEHAADVILTPDVRGFSYDGFERANELIAAGEAVARAAMPKIRAWMEQPAEVKAAKVPVPVLPAAV